jgi:hypothetical protein
VVSKVEGAAQGLNTRLGVTDREPARPQGLSRHIDCAQGHMANESKDHTLSLQSDRPA